MMDSPWDTTTITTPSSSSGPFEITFPRSFTSINTSPPQTQTVTYSYSSTYLVETRAGSKKKCGHLFLCCKPKVSLYTGDSFGHSAFICARAPKTQLALQ